MEETGVEGMTAKRHVLLCVTGLTPQVVTETLYAMHRAGEAMPAEIHLITTANGRNRAVRDLLAEKDGKLFQFLKEFALEQSVFCSERTIHVIRGRYDEELTDIRTPQENECAADCIMKLVRELTSDEEVRLTVSIAGGRKSMGFLAGYALSLYGRRYDRLCHVLTSEPFENNRDFFYPSRLQPHVFAADGRMLDTADASIALADIPFIRMRSVLTQTIADDNRSFSELVSQAQNEVAPIERLVLDPETRVAVCGSSSIELTPTQFIVYAWFASLRVKNALPAMPGKDVGFTDFLSFARSIMPLGSSTYQKVETAVRSDEDLIQYVREKRSQINAKLSKALGVKLSAPYLISSNRRRLNIKYSLGIAPTDISSEDAVLSVILGR